MIISDLLSWTARRWPDKAAIVDIDYSVGLRKAITYREFDQRINKVANALTAAGIGRGDAVFHFLRNRAEWLEAYFGIIRIGAKVVPLNFRFTSEDLIYAGSVIKPKAAILGADLSNIVAPVRARLDSIKKFIWVGECCQEGDIDYETFIADASSEHPDISVNATEDLGIYFTSGTTGTPKAICYTHGGMYATAVSNALTLTLPDNPNTIVYCPLYHTATFNFWLPHLFKGGTCTILRKFSIEYLLKAIEEEKGTEVNIPMPHCIDMIAAQQSGAIDVQDYDLSSWKTINTGAQSYPPDIIRGMQALLPYVGVQHGFGISEGGGATLTILGPEEILEKAGSVGKPAVMVDAGIMDGDWNLLPAGEIGELVFKSERTMKEYYNNSKKTSETIKSGWMRTGDIARMDKHGYIYVIDRKKDVIISGGENVYPVEVENVIMQNAKILEVAVIGTPDPKWGECVTAVVKLKPNENLSKEELLAWCKTKFPSYKRPRRVEFGDIPKSPTQKVLKKELQLKYSD